MSESTKKVILITGASSGFGKACADHLSRLGHKVYGTSRNPKPRATEDTATGPAPSGSPEMIRMDVDRDDSVGSAVASVHEREGRIDVVVNNAGLGLAGAIEDTSVDEAKALFETNFWGVLRVLRAVLPIMRAQRSGHIVNISSLGGQIGIPFQSFYSASKFALEAMTEALSMEVRPFGIRVALIEPGDARTEFTGSRRWALESKQNTAYAKQCDTAVAIMERDEMGGFSPEKVAHLLARIIEDPSPRLRYRVGSPFQMSAVAAKGILPDSVFERLLMKYYKLT